MELMKEKMVHAEEIHGRVYLWVDYVRKGILYEKGRNGMG